MYRNIFAVVFLCTVSGVLSRAQNEQTAYFLSKIGRDTVVLEECSADAHGFHGTCVSRSPRITIRDYSAAFNADGNLEHFIITSHLYNGTLVNEREFSYTDDSVQVKVRQDTTTTRYTVAAQGRPYPLFIDLFGGWERIVQHAVSTGRFGVLAGKRVLPYTVKTTSPDKLELINGDGDFGPLHVEVGKNNRLEKFDMTATTDKFIAERIPFVDVKAMAKEFTDREKSGNALGTLSPRDTVRSEIQGAHLLIDYGRPAARGRSIFGHVVLWDSVWRTGANAATQFITDKELQFGSTTVSPGTYTLFSIPGKERWLLIINRQHGQWGTVYDPTKDLVRLPLEIKHRDEMIERFTFGITPGPTQSILHFEWEHTEASIPFTVK